jgi:tRNA (adenine37-N6)-methyltransferase
VLWGGVEHVVTPIGWVHCPLVEKVRAPRQPSAAGAAAGRIEIEPRWEHALADLEGFSRIWVLFWFDRATSAPSKVLPPRSAVKRGVFATRSPHRPNPIGISAVRLERIEGLTLFVRDLDLLDGTPVLDLKPYLAYADAFPDSKMGWLEASDPLPSWEVAFQERAEAQLAWIAQHGELDLRARIVELLSLGPAPHPYRRIRRLDGGASLLAVKQWRARFAAEQRRITVEAVCSGYRARDLASGEGSDLELHRAFVSAFG